MFKISTFSDGTVIAYVKDKRYKYLVSDVGRLEYLKNKLRKYPGKLFNEIKAMGVLVDK
jgi:hypothetical protein